MKTIYELYSLNGDEAIFVSHTSYLKGRDRFFGFKVKAIYTDNMPCDVMGELSPVLNAAFPHAKGFLYGEDVYFTEEEEVELTKKYFILDKLSQVS